MSNLNNKAGLNVVAIHDGKAIIWDRTTETYSVVGPADKSAPQTVDGINWTDVFKGCNVPDDWNLRLALLSQPPAPKIKDTMNMKKYEFTGETKTVGEKTLKRIKALRSFGDVKEGDLGGWLDSESNLSHDGDCWVCDNAEVSGNAKVYGDARVYG